MNKRVARAHGQDLDAAAMAGSSKLGRATVASQVAPGSLDRKSPENVMNKRWAKDAGFEVYREKPGSRAGMRGRIKGKAY